METNNIDNENQREISFVQKSVYFTSLGCSKNLVDSQVMLGHLGLDGFEVVTTPEQAEVIIVNTCSFIEASKKESIETILELAEYKKQKCQALVVSGCMAQRYSDALEDELPEVDLIIGTGEYNKIVTLLKALEDGKLPQKSFVEIPKFIHTEFDPRLNTSPFYTAWLKISEGCNRNCTFCIIPTIRGRLRSRTVDSLVAEAKNLVESGVKELNLISQDLSDYGVDLSDENNLYELLCGLESIEGLKWIRLFYFYPDELTDEVIEKIATSEKICKYLDMPIQHFSDRVLRRMNRRITGDEIIDKVKRLKKRIPEIVIRTSIIVGFPGETEEEFEKLVQGVQECEFNHLGVFKYSDEEGTPAYNLRGKNDQETIEDRFYELYNLQREIVQDINEKLVGRTIDVLIEGEHDDTNLLLQGRYEGQAPDIDGKVIINDTSDFELEIGQMVQVEVTEVLEYDLVGRVVRIQ